MSLLHWISPVFSHFYERCSGIWSLADRGRISLKCLFLDGPTYSLPANLWDKHNQFKSGAQLSPLIGCHRPQKLVDYIALLDPALCQPLLKSSVWVLHSPFTAEPPPPTTSLKNHYKGTCSYPHTSFSLLANPDTSKYGPTYHDMSRLATWDTHISVRGTHLFNGHCSHLLASPNTNNHKTIF